MKILRNTWWGGHPYIILTIYKALIRGTLEYNLHLTNSQNYKLKEKLQLIQNQSIRMALGYRRSTPIRVIHAESKVPSIFLKIKQLADNFILKSLTLKKSTLIDSLNALEQLTNIQDKLIQENFTLLESFINIMKIHNQYENLILKHKSITI